METYDRLLRAVQLGSDAAAVVVVVVDARWEPVGGTGTRIYPPTFPLDAVDPERQRPYIVEPRLVDGERVETVVLDQLPSQANRIEEVVGHAVRAGQLDLAHLLLEHGLSGGRTVRVSSFTAPHRFADAYWRDSMVDGVTFDKSVVGQRLRVATADDCTALRAGAVQPAPRIVGLAPQGSACPLPPGLSQRDVRRHPRVRSTRRRPDGPAQPGRCRAEPREGHRRIRRMGARRARRARREG